jgi:hypothetical protein
MTFEWIQCMKRPLQFVQYICNIPSRILCKIVPILFKVMQMWFKTHLCLWYDLQIAHKTAICRNEHNSSDWHFLITRQLGHKHTFCRNNVYTKKLLVLVRVKFLLSLVNLYTDALLRIVFSWKMWVENNIRSKLKIKKQQGSICNWTVTWRKYVFIAFRGAEMSDVTSFRQGIWWKRGSRGGSLRWERSRVAESAERGEERSAERSARWRHIPLKWVPYNPN